MPIDLMKTATAAWHSVRAYAIAHKVIATIIALVAVYGAYYMYGVFTASSTATRYITTTVATGTVVATMSETGQVSASRTLTLSPKASGEVVYIGVNAGDKVAAGQIVAEIDLTSAQQSLRDAQLSLQTAELSYEKSTASSTALQLLQAKNAVTNAKTALDKAHDTVYASIANIYSDFSSVTSGLDSLLHNSSVTERPNQQNIDVYADIAGTHDTSISIYKNSAQTSYNSALAAYGSGLAAYKATNRTASGDELIALAQATYGTAQAVAEAAKDSHDFFDRVNSDYSFYNLGTSSTLAGLLSSSNTYVVTVSNDLASALTDKTSIVSAEQSLAEAEDALQTAQTGPDELALKSAALTLKKAQETMQTAQDTLENYIVRAPISGTIAAVGVQKYDQTSSGTAVATLVTTDENVKVSVNEVDASKLKVGQKATLTFDALPDITIAGTLIAVDTVGAVSQGVVSYGATVSLDTPNARIKPGMSATADIVIGTDTGLVVPNSAVKTANGQSFVEIFNQPLIGSDTNTGATSETVPTRTSVITGLTDDTNIIIESGLSSGAQVVTQTIAGTSATTASNAAQSTSIFGGGARTPAGGNGGGTRSILRTVGG